MPDIPQVAVAAAADAIERELMSGVDYSTNAESDEMLARVALEAAAPILAEYVAQKILAHAERQHPRDDRPPDAWHRHFGIAARIAAGAFYTDDDIKRLAAEALARGDYIACPQTWEMGDG